MDTRPPIRRHTPASSATDRRAPVAPPRSGEAGHRPRSLPFELFETIAAQITAAELSPGERLTEETLARTHGVSRTPIREALRLLDHAGLVEQAASRGYVVKVVDLAAVGQIYTVRAALEELAVQLAAPACGTPAFKRLAERVRDVEPGGHYHRFHEEFVELSGNEELIRLLRGIYIRTHPYRRLDQTSSRSQIHDDHLHIVQLLQEGRQEPARRLMREHVERTQAAIQSLISAGIKSVSFTPELLGSTAESSPPA